ncbi:MAG: competence protein ComEA [Myxococcota bacterium]
MSRLFRHASVAFAFALVSVMSLSALAGHSPPPDGVININTANADQLTFLPGIGGAKAERIVEMRTKRLFKRVVDLARVRGIGLRTIRKLRPWLRITGATTLAGPVKVVKPLRGSQEALREPSP